MKFLKFFVSLFIFNCSFALSLFTTDVYLTNNTNKTIIRGTIITSIKKFQSGSNQTKINKSLKIKSNETIHLFSIPRILQFSEEFHEKTTTIKKEGEKNSVPIEILAKKNYPLFPTYIVKSLRKNPSLILKSKFVYKFGKLYKELHITVEDK